MKKIRFFLIAVILIPLILLMNQKTSFGDWVALPKATNSTNTYVTQAAITGDGTNLFVFYRSPDPSLNIDNGIVMKWNQQTPASWSTEASVTNQCHNPDIAAKGDLVICSWHHDNYDMGWASNANGRWVTTQSTALVKQWNPAVAIAKKCVYLTYTQKESDGTPKTWSYLHVKCPIGCSGVKELNGGWREAYVSVTNSAITGDDNYWYVVSIQNGWLTVQKDYLYYGDFFRYNSDASNPAITLHNGNPVVAWQESSPEALYLAKWNGQEWKIIGANTTLTGIDSVRMISSSGTLYVVYVINSSTISVQKWDGSDWISLGDPSNSTSSTILTADIAVQGGDPVVAFVEDNVLQVKRYDDDPRNEPNIQPIFLLLSND